MPHDLASRSLSRSEQKQSHQRSIEIQTINISDEEDDLKQLNSDSSHDEAEEKPYNFQIQCILDDLNQHQSKEINIEDTTSTKSHQHKRENYFDGLRVIPLEPNNNMISKHAPFFEQYLAIPSYSSSRAQSPLTNLRVQEVLQMPYETYSCEERAISRESSRRKLKEYFQRIKEQRMKSIDLPSGVLGSKMLHERKASQ